MMDPEYEEARRSKNFAIAQESLRKSLSIFNEFLKGKNAVSEKQIIETLDAAKLPDLKSLLSSRQMGRWPTIAS